MADTERRRKTHDDIKFKIEETMQITTTQLLEIMPCARKNAEKNKNWLSASGLPLDIITVKELLNKYAAECGIATPLHWVYYLATIAVESRELKYSEENLNYSAAGLRNIFPSRFSVSEYAQYARKPQAIANRVYANRLGNGNERSGDGWRFRGRGLIQYTGRDNYREYACWCGYDVVANAELLAGRVGAFRSAAHFFASHGCLELADAARSTDIRRRVNGGKNGMDEYLRYVKKAMGCIVTKR